MAISAYYGITVTLADTDAHRLIDLLVAIAPTMAELSQNVGHLAIQADNSNGSSAVYIGDSGVASTRKAYELLVHDQVISRREAMNIPLGCMYVRASAATCKLNVEVIP